LKKKKIYPIHFVSCRRITSCKTSSYFLLKRSVRKHIVAVGTVTVLLLSSCLIVLVQTPLIGTSGYAALKFALCSYLTLQNYPFAVIFPTELPIHFYTFILRSSSSHRSPYPLSTQLPYYTLHILSISFFFAYVP
jgi:hypothetical protein